jgi:hypothetical protein
MRRSLSQFDRDYSGGTHEFSGSISEADANRVLTRVSVPVTACCIGQNACNRRLNDALNRSSIKLSVRLRNAQSGSIGGLVAVWYGVGFCDRLSLAGALAVAGYVDFLRIDLLQ